MGLAPITDAMFEAPRPHRRRPRRPRFRFSLRTALVLATVVCACAALFHSFEGRWTDRIEFQVKSFQYIKAAAILHPVAALMAIAVSVLAAVATYRLGPARGFTAVWVLACVSVPALAIAFSVEVPSLIATNWEDARWSQFFYAVVIWTGIMTPIASFAGWFASAQDGP